MLDHVSLAVTDLDAAVIFYERALAPLGIAKMYELEGFVAFGKDGDDDFAERTSRSPQWTGARSTRSMPRLSRRVQNRFWRLHSTPNTTLAITGLSSAIPRETTSKQCVMCPSDDLEFLVPSH